MDFRVVSMPSTYETTTGFVYLNSDDIHSEYIEVGDYIYRCLQSRYVHHRTIAMNAVQRRLVNGPTVPVSSWTPPLYNFEIADLNIEVEWRIRDTSKELPSVVNTFRSHFNRHVLTSDQEVALYVEDNLAVCKIKRGGRGIVTNKTRINVIG